VVVDAVETEVVDFGQQAVDRLAERRRERLEPAVQFVQRQRRLLAAHAQQARELARQQAQILGLRVARELGLQPLQERLDLGRHRRRASAQPMVQHGQQERESAPCHREPDPHASGIGRRRAHA
jgi:hypothetical protein